MADPVARGELHVETGRADPVSELGRERQSGLPGRDPVGDRLPLLLDRLRPQPVGADVLRGLGGLVAEDVRVTVDQLLDDGGRDVVDAERLLLVLLRDARVEDDLEQYVAELLAQFLAVAVLDGLDEFVRLLDGVLRETLVRLLRGPRAGEPDPVHDLDQIQEACAGQVVRPGQQLQVGHPHPAGAAEPGQAVGEPLVALAAHQDHHGPAARAVVHELLGRGRGVLHGDLRLPQVRQLRVVPPGAQHPVRGPQRLPGGPGQQTGGDPVAGGEQDDTTGVFSVHAPNLPPAVRGQAPGSGSWPCARVTWLIHGAA